MIPIAWVYEGEAYSGERLVDLLISKVAELKTVTTQRDIAVELLDTALSCIDSNVNDTAYDVIE